MPAFEYEALDPLGKKLRGLLSADSEVAARRELRRKKLAPLRLSRAEDKPQGAGIDVQAMLTRRKLSQKELMLVTRQLATLVGAGMPLEEAVGLIASQTKGTAGRRILMNVRGRVTEGERLSEAMAGYRESFPAVYRAMVQAGESAGGLGAVLDRLADYLERAEALKSRISVAMIYPGALGATALAVVGVLMVFIVPRIAEQFGSMGVTLPALTRAMIGISEFLQAFWPVIVIGGLAGALALMVLSRRPAVKRMIDGAILRVPGLNGFVRKIESARFARTMAILIASGAVLPDALRAARRASGNAHFQDRLGKVVEEVETGRGLSDALRASAWFPPLMVYMAAAGERSGTLPDMFGRAAGHIEQEVDGAISAGLSLLEPGIIIVMGVIVATIVLSILLPILQLNTLALG